MIWAETLDEITRADERDGWHVAYVDEGFFAYEAENENRLAWRIRGKVRRRLWAGDYRSRREARESRNSQPHPRQSDQGQIR